MSVRVERIGDATLYLGDCREVVAAFPSCFRIAAVITDPPYGQAYKPRTTAMRGTASGRGLNGHGRERRGNNDRPIYGDDVPFDPTPFLSMASTVLFWGAHRFADRLPAGQWLVWDKRVDMPSISQGDAEAAWINREGAMRVIRHRWHGLIIEPNTEESERVPGTSMAQARLHPTQKPIRVMRWCIEQARVAAGGAILDPFMGAGATGVAAAQLGHPFLGIEIDQQYFDIACRRIEEAYRQPRLFDEPTPKPTQDKLFGDAA